MSLQEIKDEFKQSEGDPHIKAKIRQLRQQRMKKRMMAAVPKASVIITNPTHYSVALSYDRGMSAPVCVAKGADNIAFKIREVAKNTTFRSWKTCRWRARSMPPSISTRRFRSSTMPRSPSHRLRHGPEARAFQRESVSRTAGNPLENACNSWENMRPDGLALAGPDFSALREGGRRQAIGRVTSTPKGSATSDDRRNRQPYAHRALCGPRTGAAER